MSKKPIYLLLVSCTLLFSPRLALAELKSPELKGISVPSYYPETGILFNRRVADDVGYLNPDMIRIEFICESNDAINMKAYDYLADQAAARGMKILGLIDYQSLKALSSDEWATGAFRTRFTNRVKEIVRHFQGRTNPIRHWEIWNEEDLDLGFPDYRIEPEPYALLLIDAYHAVKKIDEGSTVVLGGISPVGFEYESNYLEELYQTTALTDHYTSYGCHPFDVVGCHPYPEGSVFVDPDPGMGNLLNTKIKAVMNANGDRGKKVWLTEMGWNTQYHTEQQQALYLEKSYYLMESLTDPAYPGDPPYVERYFWFTYSDFQGGNLWGLVTSNYSREKPSYQKYLELSGPGYIPPPTPTPPPGQQPPVVNGKTDADLPCRVSDSDLVEAMIPAIVSGGFHPASQGDASNLTNGLFDANYLTLVLADYSDPALRVRFEFPEPVDITEVRIFAGHDRDSGNRAFQSNDIYVNGHPAALELNTGSYGQVATGWSAVSLVRWLPPEGEKVAAKNVHSLDILMWCTSTLSSDFVDRWSPLDDPEKDWDGAGPAFVAPLIKEIDVFGQPHEPSEGKLVLSY